MIATTTDRDIRGTSRGEGILLRASANGARTLWGPSASATASRTVTSHVPEVVAVAVPVAAVAEATPAAETHRSPSSSFVFAKTDSWLCIEFVLPRLRCPDRWRCRIQPTDDITSQQLQSRRCQLQSLHSPDLEAVLL